MLKIGLVKPLRFSGAVHSMEKGSILVRRYFECWMGKMMYPFIVRESDIGLQ